MTATADLDDVHRQVGARLREVEQVYTSGRRRLVELLVEQGRPATIPELVEVHPDLALSSAYRNLGVLEQVGAVARVHSGAEHARFELAEDLLGEHHHHLMCESCGRVEDFTVTADVERTIEAALEAVARRHGFVPTSHRLDLVGACTDCTALGHVSTPREAPHDR
ncbi:MAG: transcriptional repressor [Actinobacteria bacterium]|nr:transcriptional repressor [Actinomycetota bacterium]